MSATLTGTVLDGRWRLVERIASGSFAHVYRAVDTETGVARAVKVLVELAPAEAEPRFLTEFETLRRLRHPRIVAVHAVGRVEGRPYMVLDLVDGGNVLSLVQEAGPLPLAQACIVGVQVLAALAEAHAQGIIHRDVKPGNVLVDAEGARLCDFGIARVDTGQRLTQMGASLGTLLYMAPEQRLDAHGVDLTADLYGVGCLLYRLLSEESPADLFTAGPDSSRWKSVPEAIRPVLLRATRATPAERYPDARSMAEALLSLLLPEERAALLAAPGCQVTRWPAPDKQVRIRAETPEVTEKVPRPRPSPWPWRVGLVVMVGVGVVAWVVWRG